jgi:hypothetical protein
MGFTLIKQTSDLHKTSCSHYLSLAFSLHEAAAYLHDKIGQEPAVLFLLQVSACCASFESAESAQTNLFAALQQACPDDDIKISTEELDNLIMSVAELLEQRSSGT